MAKLTTSAFIERRLKIKTYAEKEALLKDAVDTENEYRGLFARHRESWEIPEVADPLLGLVDVYAEPEALRCLPRYEEDKAPRCFELTDKRLPEGELSVAESLREFEQSWDCFGESQLRFLNWKNVFAAGGSVAACLAPLPKKVREGSWAEGRMKRRQFFHDEAYPGSDVDLFLYGLDQAQAQEKLVEIFEAVQAANPYKVLCFRSANAITLVSQYPFRHIQIVLRLYNSPAEVLMGFDVDSCACGYDGNRAYMCQRTAIAFAAQANTVDMSRRSASYEMRLSKYAERGFEVVVPQLVRKRVDPSLYERRFDQVQGLARMLVLERLRTPEARFRYRMEQKLKRAARGEQMKLRRQLHKVLRDKHELARVEDNTVALEGVAGAELSNYSTVFLPWGPAWTAQRVQKVMRQKDQAINRVEFRPGGRVVQNTRKYRIHVCATGNMAEVIQDPWPKDPAIPADVPKESLTQLVYGPVSWLVDNPGRQQIGSFHPITDGDWMEGAYLSAATEELAAQCAADNGEAVAQLLAGEGGTEQLTRRDYLGRTALHVAVLCAAPLACEALLARPEARAEVLAARLADGRTALHLAALRGLDVVVEQLLAKRRRLLEEAEGQEEVDQLDIDGADWELKLSPLQYTIVFGHEQALAALLREGASAKKLAVHKDLNMSCSALALCGTFARESKDLAAAGRILKALLDAGATTLQVDMTSRTVYHDLAGKPSDAPVLEMFLQADENKALSIDVVSANGCTPLAEAVTCDNLAAVKLLLAHGAAAQFTPDEYAQRRKLAAEGSGQKQPRMFHMMRQADDIQRCPVLLAAENVHVDVLRALLEHDPALVTATTKRNGTQVHTALDLVEAKRTGLDNGREQREKQLKARRKAVEVATEALATQADGSYGFEEWSLEMWKLTTNLLELEQQATAVNPGSEEEEDQEATNRKRIEEAAELIKACGGKPHPLEEDSEQKSKTPLHMSHFGGFGGFGGGFHGGAQDKGIDPLTSHIELGQLHAPKRLMQGEQSAAQQLFEAVFAGDPAAVSAAGEHVLVSIASSHGRTPLWYAVAKGNVECVRVIFQLAEKQFRPQPPRAAAEAADPNDIAGQLKRINNLDLASGQGVPKDSGPSPDEMRQKLEALQQGIAKVGQESSGEAKAANVGTKVPAYKLLLEKSPMIAEDTGPLADFLLRIRNMARDDDMDEAEEGDGFLKEADRRKSKLVSLSPLELALIRGDLPMLEALLALAAKKDGAAKESGAKDAKGEALAKADDAGEEEDEADKEKEEEEEEENGDDDDDEGDSDGGAAAEEERAEPHVDVRCEMLVNANGSLGNMNMLQLAVALDNADAFLMLAAFAKEYALFDNAVNVWQREVESRSGKEAEEKPHVLMHMYGGNGASLLQFALWTGAHQVTRLILSGAADEALVGWLDVAATAEGVPLAIQGRKGRPQQYGGDKFIGLRKWLVKHIHATGTPRPELMRRLFGPEVEDMLGRTALFYATSETLPVLLAAGAGQLNLQHKALAAGRARRKFRQSPPSQPAVEHEGHTALLAAVENGMVKLALKLVDAGCDVTAVAGKQRWNCLHFAVSCRPGLRRTQQEEDPHVHTRRMAEELLARVSPETAAALLFAPDAEHTPLMLAVQQGNEPLVRLFAERMVAMGEPGKAAITRRDKHHSSNLHLAAAAAEPRPGVVRALLEAREASGEAMAPLGPNVENAAGATPLELLMEKVAEVWNNNQGNQGMRNWGGGLFGPAFSKAGPPQKKGKAAEEHPKRRCYELLSGAVDQTKPGQRLTASFDDVQLAARHATTQAGKEGPDDDGFNPGGMAINLVQNLTHRGLFGGGVTFPQFRD